MKRIIILTAVTALLCAGCSSGYYAGRANRDVERILDRKTVQAIGDLEADAVRPETEDAAAAEMPAAAKVLTLKDALAVAVTSNRDFLAEKEEVYLSALALTKTRRDFGPVLGLTLGYLVEDGPYLDAARGVSATASVTKVLPTGAQAGLSVTSSETNVSGNGTDTADTTVTLSVTQPLLAGAGREASHEALTVAERRVIYDIRDFVRYREAFTIGMVRDYYAILSEKQVVENTKRDHELSIFLRRRAEARFELGEVSALDKFRAQQQELEAKNALIQRQQEYESRLDEFKITLGMPLDERIDVQDVWPKMVPVRLKGTSALRAALANRLDLRSEKQRAEDAERAARIAKNALLPELGLTAGWSVGTDEDAGNPGEDWDAGEYSVGLALEVPIDKIEERNAYRSALIALDRQKRAYALKEDRIRKEVRDALRQVRRLEATVGIQDTKRKLSERRLKNARYLFDEGSAGNRDIIEAQQDLLDAENAYVRALASYEVARLELRRTLGLLFINRDGSWGKE